MNDAFICDAIRTPVGRFGGSLASVRADETRKGSIFISSRRVTTPTESFEWIVENTM